MLRLQGLAFAQGLDGGACRLDSRWTEPRHPQSAAMGFRCPVQLRDKEYNAGPRRCARNAGRFVHKGFLRRKKGTQRTQLFLRQTRP